MENYWKNTPLPQMPNEIKPASLSAHNAHQSHNFVFTNLEKKTNDYTLNGIRRRCTQFDEMIMITNIVR